MIELLRSQDPVFLSRLSAELAAAGIRCFIFDAYTSGVYGGALAAVAHRVVVAEEDAPAARRVLAAIEAEAADD